MATVFGQAGAGATKRGLIYVIGLPLSILVLFAFISPILGWSLGRAGLLGWLVAFVVAGYFISKERETWREMAAMMREGGNWLKGAKGERRVDAELAKLPAEFAVFHDYHPVRASGERVRWNVDHVVIGPTGAFVIETKNYTRTRVPAAKPGSWEMKRVKQVERNARELKDKMRSWSGGSLAGLFVVPILVYAQENAFVERVREGAVRVVPLRRLVSEIEKHSEGEIDLDKAGRIASVLYAQMEPDLRATFRAESEAYGRICGQARDRAHKAALAASAAVEPSEPAPAASPTVCPECGGKLVRKPVRKGPRAGKHLLGCENYKAIGCGYCVNID